MSRPVAMLFRRVSTARLRVARDLVPAVAAMGADVSTPEDVLRFAVEVGLVALGCAAPPGAEAGARRLVDAVLEARENHADKAPPLHVPAP